MANWLLDTTVFVDFFRGRAEARRLIQRVIEGRVTASFSVITEAELWTGVRSEDEEVRYESLLSVMERVGVDATIARLAGQLRGRDRGHVPALPDALIAATARLRSEPILTRNARHFEPFALEVKVETY